MKIAVQGCGDKMNDGPIELGVVPILKFEEGNELLLNYHKDHLPFTICRGIQSKQPFQGPHDGQGERR
jgi:hypothetical protein